eukprot:tig00020531_g10018.t1
MLQLPDQLISARVLPHLEALALLALSQTCRRLRRIVDDSEPWEDHNIPVLNLYLSVTPETSQKHILKFVACRTVFLQQRLRKSAASGDLAQAARALEGVAQGFLEQITDIVAEVHTAQVAAVPPPLSPGLCLDNGWCGFGDCFSHGRDTSESPLALARCGEALAQHLSDGITALNSLGMLFRTMWGGQGKPASNSSHATYALEEFFSFFVIAAELFLRALALWEAVCSEVASKLRWATIIGLLQRAQLCCEAVHFISNAFLS